MTCVCVCVFVSLFAIFQNARKANMHTQFMKHTACVLSRVMDERFPNKLDAFTGIQFV